MKNPEIRFIDDNIDWQNENLSDALIERNTASYKNNGLEHVSLTKDGVIPKSDRYERDFLVTTKNKKYKITKINDICYNPANLKFGVICRNKYKDGIFSPIYITFETTENYSPNFVELLVTNPKFIRASLRYQEGTVYERMAVSPDNLLKMPISIPNIELQDKISKIFEDIDIKIKEEIGLIQKLKDTKSALLIKMFPQENQSVPELRFDGFTNDWEQRKLGDIFKEYSEKHHEELPPLMIIQGGGTIRRDESDRNISFDTANLYNYKVIHIDDFIVHLRSFEGGLEKSNHNGLISPAYHTFHGDNISSDFYYPYFRSKKFINIDLTPHVYGVRDGRSIDMNGLKTILIPYTSYTEQEKIGRLLLSIDKTITLHQRKPFHLNFSL